MKIFRKTEFDTDEFMIGDQINEVIRLHNPEMSKEGLAGFSDEIRERLVGEVRVPYAGEMFPKDEIDFLEEDDYEQLPLMKERRNRIAFCQDDWEWGWLMNRSKRYAAGFGFVGYSGHAANGSASPAGGVRRAFLIK